MNPPPSVLYPPLPLQSGVRSSRKTRVCIASFDFVGPVKNGGVGTAFTSLGEGLAAAGHDVTFLFLAGQWCENRTMDYWVEYYRKKNIRFVPMPASGLSFDTRWHLQKGYEGYLWLKDQNFDVVHFSEWKGSGYYSLLAKQQGLAFAQTVLCVHTHGPTLWHKLSNSEYVTQLDDVEIDFIERSSVRLADVLASPSQYLVRWMIEQGWELPKNCYVQQYLRPATARKPLPDADRLHRIRELVFFGRLEYRKGLVLFCDALDQLKSDPALLQTQITFLGKIDKVNGRDSADYLAGRAKAWPWKWQIVSDRDQAGAMDYLQGNGRLAVLPSLVDNLPNTVLECLGAQVPFVASDAGGIPEMIAPADHAAVCFPLRARAFAAKLRQVLLEGIRPAAWAVESGDTERAWVRWHEELPAQSSFGLASLSVELPGSQPLVSLCISHWNRPHYLRQAIASAEAQDYPNFEVVLVDDGSTSTEAKAYLAELEPLFQRRGWQLVRNSENRYPGAARNLAVKHARGEYLVFLDDDNYAKPHEISTLVRVARKTGADILTCFLDTFTGPDTPRMDMAPKIRWVFTGDDAATGALRNSFGDTNSLIRREVFLALGGFHEDWGVGHEDWEFHAKAVLKGYKLQVVPEALAWYRLNETEHTVNRKTPLHANLMANIRPYLDAVPPGLRRLVLLVQGQLMASVENAHAATDAANAAYTQHTIHWRSQCEAAKALAKLKHEAAAINQLMDALTSAQLSSDPRVIQEALLEIGATMRSLDGDRARQILQLGLQLATNLRLVPQQQLARSLLDSFAGAGKAAGHPVETRSLAANPAPVLTADPSQPAPRRLMLIVPWLAIGGADKFNLDLVAQLRQRNWQITIVTTLNGDYRWLPEFKRYTDDIQVLPQLTADAEQPQFIQRLIEARQTEVVLISNAEIGYRCLPMLRRAFPQVAFLDYCHMEDPTWLDGGYPRLALQNAGYLDRSLVSSEYLKQWMITRGGQPDHIAVVHTNIDTSQWQRDPSVRIKVRAELGVQVGQTVLLYACRLVDQKQPQVFAETVRRLKQAKYRFTAIVAGDGPHAQGLKDFVTENQLQDCVRLLGAVPNTRIRELMQAADIYFLPSQWEGVALVAYEALACSVPVVSADVGGQKELITKDCGRLIPHSHPQEETARYVEVLSELLDKPKRLRRLSEAARARVKAQFELQQMGDKMAAHLTAASQRRLETKTPTVGLVSLNVPAVTAPSISALPSPALVSVIIPCYNQAQFLPEAVASVVQQTWPNWEIVIVNDGSPDDTTAVARWLIREHPKQAIRLIEQANGGPSKARNTAIAEARGEFVLLLDADDKLAPAMIERTMAVLAQHPKVGFVYTHIQHFGLQDGEYPLPDFDANIEVFVDNIASICSLLRKEVWQKAGGFNEKMRDGYEDWDFWMSCVEKGWQGHCLHEPLFHYRLRPVTRNTGANRKRLRLIAQMISHHPALFTPLHHAWAEQTMKAIPPGSAPVEAPAPKVVERATQWMSEADRQVQAGNLSAACQAVQEAAKLLPEDAQIMQNLGNLLLFANDLNGAWEQFAMASWLQPMNPDPLVKRASVCLRLGQLPEFEAALMRVFQLSPKHPDAHLLLAELNLRQGRSEQAGRGFQEVLQSRPDDVRALAGLGKCLAEAGEADAARALFERVLALEPDHAEARKFLQPAAAPQPPAERPAPTVVPAPAPVVATVPSRPPRSPRPPLSVTYLISNIRGVTGGNQTLLRQANVLAERGHQVTIVTCTPPPSWFDLKAKVIQVSAEDQMGKRVPPCDAVISTYFTNTAELLNVNCPVKLYYAQGDQYVFSDRDLGKTDDFTRLMRKLSRVSYAHPAIRFIANSHNLAKAVERNYGRKADAILPVCTDQTIFHPLPRSAGPPWRILVVGPDVSGSAAEPLDFKGMRETRQALELLQQRGLKFQAVRMSGTPPEIFRGFPCEFHLAPSDDLKTQIYGNSHILIYASHYDSCPRPPQEAMAAGVAVVCTDTDGAREYCRDGENALLVPVRSPAAIADAVQRLMEDVPLWKRLVSAGQATAAEFPQEREWDEMEDLLVQYVDQARTGKPSFATPAVTGKVTTSRSAPITLPPCALLGHLSEARQFFNIKRLPAAWDSVRAALKHRPFHPEAYLLLAEIALAAGDSVSARKCAQHARDIAPDFKPAKRFLKGSLRGNAKPAWLVLPEVLQDAHAGRRPHLSVCLIVKNEERFLGQCLESVKGLADQIVVVDTGSTDRTVEIARHYQAEVHSFTWCDDFSAARNAALEHVTGDWVLALDADEELPLDQHDALRKLLRAGSVMSWRLPLQDVGREADGLSYVPRLFRNAPGLFYVGRVHEQVFTSLEVRRQEWGLDTRLGDARLRHYGYTKELTEERDKVGRNLRLLELAIQEHPGEPNLLMNYGLELTRSQRREEGLVQYRAAFAALAAEPPALVVPELREMLLTQFATQLLAAQRHAELVEVLTSPLAVAGGGLTASLHFALGLAHMELKDFAAGAEQFRQCLAKRDRPALAPINPEIRKAGPRHCLARCLAGMQPADAAEREFQAARQEAPDAVGVIVDYARFLHDQGRSVEGLQLLHPFTSEHPQAVAAWLTGGLLALSQPAFLEVAVDWTAEALRHCPDNLDLQRQRAEALVLSGQPEAALPVLRALGGEGHPATLGALILCETALGQNESVPPAALAGAVTQEFVKVYRRLLEFGAEATLRRVNEGVAGLDRVLPRAAELLRAVIAEAQAG